MRGILAVPLALFLAACAGGEPAPVAKIPEPAAAAPAPAAAPLPPTGTLPGDRIPAFTAKVVRSGGETTLDAAAPKGTTVLVVMSTQCPDCAEAIPSLRRAEDAFASRGVDFVYLYPMRSESADEKAEWHKAKGFRAGLVVDSEAAIAKSLKAGKTPTAYLVDPRGVILYRGAVISGDGGGAAAHPLADAIDEHLAGKAVSVSSVEPAG